MKLELRDDAEESEEDKWRCLHNDGALLPFQPHSLTRLHASNPHPKQHDPRRQIAICASTRALTLRWMRL